MLRTIRWMAWLPVALVMISCNSSAQSQEQVYERLNPTEFNNTLHQLDNALLMDVRTPGEYAEGHIQDAVNINVTASDFEKNIEKLDKDQPVLVYCRSGHRSQKAAKLLQQHGFSKIYELSNGIMGWQSAGFPVVK